MTIDDTYDVAVVGAGAAGVAAAAAAAMGGASVLLVEKWDRLGGVVTAGMHRSLCGLYAGAPAHATETLNDGIQRQLVGELLRMAPNEVAPRQLGRAWVLEFSTGCWEAALARLCSRPGLTVLPGTHVAAVARTGARVEGIELRGAAERSVRIGCLVDCTGTGQVLGLIGADAVLDERSAPPVLSGYAVRFDGLSGDCTMLPLQVPYVLAEAVAQGTLLPDARFTTFALGPGEGQGICKLAVGPLPEQSIFESHLRSVLEYLRQRIPALSHARAVEHSPQVLPRSGRRLSGLTVLEEADVLQGRRRAEPSVHGWWPIEFWDVRDGPQYRYPPPNQAYDIPLSCLRSRKLENLFAAGACLSATPMATASARVAGICAATGAAAGQLAATCGGAAR